MAELTVSPRRNSNRYTRLNALEVEDPSPSPSPAPAAGAAESDLASEFWHFCHDLHHQVESACHIIDWDRIFLTALATISLALVLFAFFPYLQTQLDSDQQLHRLFALDSLTISDFQAAPDRVTGRCRAVFNVTNLGDRSVYHETSVMSVFIDHELLWVVRTGDFFVDVGDSLLFNVSIERTTVSVPASFVPTAMVESRTRRKPLRFKLKYDGMVREGLAAWYEERSHVYIVCGWIEMQFINETTLAGGPANCSVDDY